MINDSNVYRAASIMLRIYGTEAGHQAALEAEASHSKGDLRTCAAWERVFDAVEDFLSPKIPPGVLLN